MLHDLHLHTYKHVDWKMPEKCDVKLQGTAAFKGRIDTGVLCTDADDPESNTNTKTDTNTNTISGTNSGSNSFKGKPRGGQIWVYVLLVLVTQKRNSVQFEASGKRKCCSFGCEM